MNQNCKRQGLPLLPIIAILAVMMLSGRGFGANETDEIVRTFSSPDNSQKLAVVSTPTKFPPGPPTMTLTSVATDGSLCEIKEAPEPKVYREIHGTYFLENENTQPLWIDNRFAVFQDDIGMLIVDAQHRQILLRNHFENYVKLPNDNRWVAIEWRPLGRQQENLDNDFQDTIFFIDPNEMAKRFALSTEDDPFKHVNRVNVGGIVLGHLNLTKNNQSIAVLVWKLNTLPEGMLFDAKTGKELRRLQLHVKVPDGRSMIGEIEGRFAPKAREILINAGLLQK